MDVVRVVAPSPRLRDDVGVADELARTADQASTAVPFEDLLLDAVRNRRRRMELQLPCEPLQIIALEHEQQRAQGPRVIVARLPVERTAPPPALAPPPADDEQRQVTLLAPRAKPAVGLRTQPAGWASGPREPDAPVPEEPALVAPEPGVAVALQHDTAGRGLRGEGERGSRRGGSRLPEPGTDRDHDDPARGAEQIGG